MVFKKITALAICLLLLASLALASCGGTEQSESPSESEPEKVLTDSIEDYVKMPAFRWRNSDGSMREGYDKFNLCIYSNNVATTYFSEDIVPNLYSTTDEVLNAAVTARNDEIELKYGVKITAEAVDDVVETLKNDVSSSLNNYDATMPFMRGAANSLAADGMLYDLFEFGDYIHFDQPWWDKDCVDSVSIGHKLYMATGDISIMPKIVSFGMTFNKVMMENRFPDIDLYQMVRDGEWTFDRMIELCREVTYESDGSAGMTYADNWGLSSSYSDAGAFYLASGQKFITKDPEDLPVIALGDETSVSTAIKILENLQLENVWVYHCNTSAGQVPNIWQTSLDVFGENRALFRTSAFSAIKKLRAYDGADEFGLVPVPKMTSTQDTYHTYCNTVYAHAAVIPNSLDRERAEFAAYMLELMAYGGMKHITKAYYDTILKTRDLKDAESEEMLDKYIFNHLVYDLGNVYDFGGIQSMLGDLMANNSTDIASSLQGNLDKIQSAIDETVEEYLN